MSSPLSISILYSLKKCYNVTKWVLASIHAGLDWNNFGTNVEQMCTKDVTNAFAVYYIIHF